jgi:helicase
MKYQLPNDHGLSDEIVSSLVYREGDEPALTDAQYAALETGLGNGESVLVVSPTSTGKTQIAVWAIANGIETNANTVYLVTHRALAKQKFHDFQELLLTDFLDGNPSSIVLATGDAVIDGRGESPADPLRASLLVATYEKYLAMLSASGVPSSMANTVVVCDEIQLLGDKQRGRNVEVLLTLLKQVGWRQFVGLSAVLEPRDSADLSNWLNVTQVREATREKDLRYEYWTGAGIESVSTSRPEETSHHGLPAGVTPGTIALVRYLENQEPAPLPVIVFCMRKQDVFDLASADLEDRIGGGEPQLPLDLGNLPETTANSFLARALAHRIAIHSADLTDDERKIVEEGLLEGTVDVVYATSTLAAGVNFPLGAAIFHKWVRWDSDQRTYLPIDPSEFHNMAGRVGRMGSHHDQGRVIFFSATGIHPAVYRQYLELDELPPLQCRIDPTVFDQLGLQLIASGLCHTRRDVNDLICTSFSGLREADNNLTRFQSWPAHIEEAIGALIQAGMVVEMADGRLLPTPVGKAIAHSGLRPISGAILLDYFARKGEILATLLPSAEGEDRIDRFAYLIFAACFSTPEFHPHGGVQQSRFLPWPLQDQIYNASDYADDLLEPNWAVDPIATNAAQIALDWIKGAKIGEQEKIHSSLSAGMLYEMYRNLGWVLQGVAAILSAASDLRTPDLLRPASLKGRADFLAILRKLPRVITRLSFRISSGLPDDVLWMNALNQSGEPFQLMREEILSLRERGFGRPELIMLGTPEADEVRREAFANARPSPHAKANWLRDRCRSWKSDQRIRAAERHRERARGCQEVGLIDEYYSSRRDDFETIFERILAHIGVAFDRLDDRSQIGAPDYLLQLENSPPLIFELKSRVGNNLVDYNRATEVLAAAEIHGHKETFCVTLCHPGVDPSVPMNITGSGRLCVVESNDLGEGLLRLCQGRLSQEQLWQWLATPGQALSVDLPYTEH